MEWALEGSVQTRLLHLTQPFSSAANGAAGKMLAACASGGVQPTLHQAGFWRLRPYLFISPRGSPVRFCRHLRGGKHPKAWMRKVGLAQEMLGEEAASLGRFS